MKIIKKTGVCDIWVSLGDLENRDDFIAYIAANVYHPDLDKIKQFYVPEEGFPKSKLKFEIKQIMWVYRRFI